MPGRRVRAAEEEVAFAASLCDHAPQTLLAVQRSVEDGEIRERFRTLKPRAGRRRRRIGCMRMPAPLPFTRSKATTEPAEEVDLLGLIRTDRRIAHERILGRIGPSSDAARRSWRADGDARTDHGLSGAARIDAAGRRLRGRAHAACEPAGRSAASGLDADIAALADADARENWTFMVNFRDRLVAAPSLEAVYVALARKGAGDLPPIFLSQLCHLILRNALEGCDDPYMLRAAELFYRSQLADRS